ncbi:hypothetical protein SK128_011770 [Halocaridina rubra]|uniref:Uncharacterized protein n=1 Tax=Halocaridina rubra TaxID=373956 RepID=A0AAN9ABR9_HALRR
MSEMVSSCSSTADALQLIQISGIGGDVNIDKLSLEQRQVLNIDCLLTNENVRTMVDRLKEDIQSEKTNAVVKALLDATGVSSVLKDMDRVESSASKNKESTVIGETLRGISDVVSSAFMT